MYEFSYGIRRGRSYYKHTISSSGKPPNRGRTSLAFPVYPQIRHINTRMQIIHLQHFFSRQRQENIHSLMPQKSIDTFFKSMPSARDRPCNSLYAQGVYPFTRSSNLNPHFSQGYSIFLHERENIESNGWNLLNRWEFMPLRPDRRGQIFDADSLEAGF
jgi:hypothetical protein